MLRDHRDRARGRGSGRRARAHPRPRRSLDAAPDARDVHDTGGGTATTSIADALRIHPDLTLCTGGAWCTIGFTVELVAGAGPPGNAYDHADVAITVGLSGPKNATLDEAPEGAGVSIQVD